MEGFDYEAALAACARREPGALRLLYDRDAAFLIAVAMRIVKRREAAADVVHDAFLSIWHRASTFDPSRGAGRAWIVSIVRHRALKVSRAARRDLPLGETERDAVPDDGPDPYAALATAQDASALHRCLEELAPERRRIVLLAYVDGLSQSEIACRIGAPLGTVKAWVRRSLMSLKDCLS